MYGDSAGSIHLLGILGLVIVFLVGTLRSINLGALSLAMTFFIGALLMQENLADIYGGFPVDLLILLAGVTYLFGIATSNGTIERLVTAAAGRLQNRRAFIPWMVFVVAAAPTMAGALGSAGVALVAPIALRLAVRCSLDRRMIALMVLHGAACGNFSPLNALGVIVLQGAARAGLEISATALLFGNIAYNVVLGIVIFCCFGGLQLVREDRRSSAPVRHRAESAHALGADQWCTLLALVAIAIAALAFKLNIGFLALSAAACLHVLFPRTSVGSERKIAWEVILLVCGIVTYVSALQRYGTVDMIGASIAALDSPSLGALLICAVAAVTSAFASSAGILGVMMFLAAPFMIQGGVDATGFLIALAVSATVVDSSPFSTAGALVVANAAESERYYVYRSLLVWAGVMVLTAPLISWILFVLLP